MSALQAEEPSVDARVRGGFQRQRIMNLIGAVLTRVAPGAVEIELPFRDDLTQQHGYVHGGIVAAIADSACGYASLSLAPVGTEVLTLEYKINFLAPASGAKLVARGHVVRAGRTVSVCEGKVLAVSGDTEMEIAAMLATMMFGKGAK